MLTAILVDVETNRLIEVLLLIATLQFYYSDDNAIGLRYEILS
jgi:hypothetical protein